MPNRRQPQNGSPRHDAQPARARANAGRGFAGMDPDTQRGIASEGGKAAHASGHAHEFTPEEAREAGRKGGEARSGNRARSSRRARDNAAVDSGRDAHEPDNGGASRGASGGRH